MTSQLANITIGNGQPLALIAGPCVIESRDHTLRMAESIAQITQHLGIPYIFKSSYDKANRSSAESFRGPGIIEGLSILTEVKRDLGIPILSDVHTPEEAAMAGPTLDCLQVPAFLCRQTDLLFAVGRAGKWTGKCVNVKKGQFMSPEEMGNVVEKVTSTGNYNVLLTDRGTFFGYNRLVNDMTCIPRMQQFAPVVFDATHSCQQPGGAGTHTGGVRQFAEPLALAALAAGADALFLEVHDNPHKAWSDAATVYPLDDLERLLGRCVKIYEAR